MIMRPAIAAKWEIVAAVFALASALAGCGHGSYGGVSTNSPPMLSFVAHPATITLGQSSSLTWSSSQGTSCTASGAWDGTEPATGTLEVTPTATGDITYMLSCSGDAYQGSATGSVTLTVAPASVYTATNLVADYVTGEALTADANLINPWGIAFGPTTIVGVANNHSETMTLYGGEGQMSPIIVQLPSNASSSFSATGIVVNAGGPANLLINDTDFLVNQSGMKGPAFFILAGEGGMIAAWSPAVDITHAFAMYTDLGGAVYKGLALANNGVGNFLYATNFTGGTIDVFDATFTKQIPTVSSFSFVDPTLPAGYAPFGIQAIRRDADAAARIYVSYAKRRDDVPDEDAHGPGLGIVNVFDTNGNFIRHLLAEGGLLDAPWGMALAPDDFGTLSHALLVGNFGDGKIHGYDPITGRYLGSMIDAAGAPFTVPGLWGLAFGNDAVNQPHATLFFAAGTNDEADGLYGRIDLGETPPALGSAPFLTLTAPDGDLSGTVTLTADVGTVGTIAKVQFFMDGSTLIGTATSAPYTIAWNTTAVGDGDVVLRAIATDTDGNVGSSQVVLVSIANMGL